MKLKHISAACLALCSAGVFAAVPAVVCDATTLIGMVNTCAPEVTFFVGGASAPSAALNATLTAGAGIFDTTKVRGKIFNVANTVSGMAGTTDKQKTATVGYIGIGATGTAYANKRVLVIYNKANGSAAGVATLLTGKGPAGEQMTLITASPKTLGKGIAGTCTSVTVSTGGSLGEVDCATEALISTKWGADAQKSMHMAISDVFPDEVSPATAAAAKIKWKTDKFPAETVAIQGFGVVVNPVLYTKLIEQQVAAKRLPDSCLTSETVGGATDVITAVCQPNIDRSAYASLISGNANSADAFLGTTGDTKLVKLFRRVDSSGTQATSNIFFLNQGGYSVKPALNTFVPPVAAGTVGGLTVTEGSTTGHVVDGLAAEVTDYAIGYVSLENTYSMTKASSKLKGNLFVKLDGISPNFNAAGTALDSKARAGMQAGYPAAFELAAIKSAAVTIGDYADIYSKIVTGLKDPAQNLAGIAYIGSTDTAKNTAFTRGGRNFMPLTK